jgi:hypothetical protein
VGSTADQAGCDAAGTDAIWIAESTTKDGVYRIVNDHPTLGKVCLTVEGLGSTPKGYKDMAQVVASPCSALIEQADDASQLWSYSHDDPWQQLRSVGLSAQNGGTSMCLAAVPPVPLIEVAAALAVVRPNGGGDRGLYPHSNPQQQLAEHRTTYTSEGEVTINAKLHLKANTPTTFVVSVVSSRDNSAAAGSPPPRSVSAAAVDLAQSTATRTAVAAQRVETLAWWSSYWNASAVNLGPDRQLLEGFWYGMNYMAGMQNRAGKQATGLWGPWIQADTMNWSGDYTLDYNFQSEYYGAFSSNHPELADNFFPVITKALPFGRRRAAYPNWGDRAGNYYHSGPAGQIMSGYTNANPAVQGNYSGIELPSHLSAYGGYYMGDLGTRGIIGWVLLVFIDHYDYTHDVDFLANTTYPMLVEAAAFFESYLTYNATTDAYDLENVCALEGCTLPFNSGANRKPQRQVTMTKGWIAATFKAVHRLSVVLEVDAARRPKWQQYLQKLAPYPTTTSENQTVFDECENSGDFGGNSRYPVVNFGHIHPAAMITRLSVSEELMQIGRNTVDQINKRNRWVPENGLCMGWPPAAVVSDNATYTMDGFTSGLKRTMMPNYVPQIFSGCVAEQAGALQGINDLMMQSYDGAIVFFPAGWDAGGSSFTSLRARGAFLVSASWANGAVDDGIAIVSEAGANCSFANPFPSSPVVHDAGTESAVPFAGAPSSSAAGQIYTFPTSKGGRYAIARS